MIRLYQANEKICCVLLCLTIDVCALKLQEVDAPDEASVLEQRIIDVRKLNFSFSQRLNFADLTL